MKKLNRSYLIIAALIVIGAALRFYQLGEESLWFDEIATWHVSSFTTFSGMIQKGVIPDVHPPLFPVIIYCIEQWFGDTEFLLRLPSAIAGILTIYFLFILGRKLYNEKTGLISAAFMTFLWFPLNFSQEARAYSILLLFTIISFIFWIDILKAYSDNNKNYPREIAYIIIAALMCYTHYYGLLLVFLQGIAAFLYFIKSRNNLLRLFFIYLIIVLLYSPWLAILFRDVDKGPYWFGKFKLTFFIRSLWHLSSPTLAVFIIMCVFLGISTGKIIYDTFSKKSSEKSKLVFASPGVLLILWLIVPFLVVWIKSSISTPIFTPRHLVISLPAFYILTARGFTLLPVTEKFKNTIAISFVLLLAVDLFFIQNYYGTDEKPQYREAAEFVTKEINPDEDVIVEHGYLNEYPYINYYIPQNLEIPSFSFAHYLKRKKEFWEFLEKYDPKRIFYIYDNYQSSEGINEYMQDNFILAGHREFLHIDVFIYKIPKK